MTPPQKGCARAGCTNKLTGKQKKYCSNTCSRIDMHARKNQLAESVALEAIREEVLPVVQEALTEQVLQEIEALVQLLPEAVKALQRNLHSDDEAERRQAAYLIMKYTIGNSSVAPAPQNAAGAGINISFGVPQQGDEVDRAGSVLGEAVELPEPQLRECLECHMVKEPEAFVGSSDRCQTCHDDMLADIGAKFPGVLSSTHG